MTFNKYSKKVNEALEKFLNRDIEGGCQELDKIHGDAFFEFIYSQWHQDIILVRIMRAYIYYLRRKQQ